MRKQKKKACIGMPWFKKSQADPKGFFSVLERINQFVVNLQTFTFISMHAIYNLPRLN